MNGNSTSSSIARLPSSDQIRSYSRRPFSSVGWGDHSMPESERRPEVDLNSFRD